MPLLMLPALLLTPALHTSGGHTRRATLAAGGLAFATHALAARADENVAKRKFKRLSPIQFIAALGDPKASSGIGAEKWGLWREDPGPRGVYLRDYEKRLARGVAPAGWTFDPQNWWVEEHGLIMETPAPLPLKRLERQGEKMVVSAPERRYVVTGDRDVTAVLTVQDDGRWKLSKGTLYDVTHQPCRSAVYTPATASGSCRPSESLQRKFPVKPGALMPAFDGCNTQDWAVLFVVGVEA